MGASSSDGKRGLLSSHRGLSGHHVWDVVVVAALLAMASVSVAQGVVNAVLLSDGSQDFQWEPSRALLQRSDPYAAFLARGGAAHLSQAPNYPVIGLVLFLPFAAMDWDTAKVAWAGVNLGLTAVILMLVTSLIPEVSARRKLLLVVAFLCSTPWRNGLGNGQHALLSLAAFLAAVVLPTKVLWARPFLLAVSCVKYSIGAPLALIWLHSRTGVIALAWAAFIHLLAAEIAAEWLRVPAIDLVQGPWKVARIATGPGYLDVFAVATHAGFDRGSIIPAIVAASIGAGTWTALRSVRDVLLVVSLVSVTALAVIFHLGYDYVLLVVPLAYAFRENFRGALPLCFLLLVGATWFGNKAVNLLIGLGTLPESFQGCWYWFEVLLLYGTLCTAWWTALKAQPLAET